MPVSTPRPLCRAVHTGVFQSREFRQLPEDGHARMLLLCLLIHPHGGTFHLPGLYHVGQEALREAASMSRRGFAKAERDLTSAGLLQTDFAERLYWLPVAVHLVAPPGNPNVAKGYARSLAQLPSSPLVTKAVTAYAEQMAVLGSAFAEPFGNALPVKLKPFVEPFRVDQEGVGKHSNHNNPDDNRNHDEHCHQGASAVRSQLLSLARKSGWVGEDSHKIDRLLAECPNLSEHDIDALQELMNHRPDVHDPFRYLAAALKRRKHSERLFATKEDCHFSQDALPDGAELTFDA